MSVERRISVSLFISLVLWYPSMRSSITGEISLEQAGLRYLLGLGVVWVSVDLIDRVFTRYAVAVEAERLQREIEEIESRPRRRLDDNQVEPTAAERAASDLNSFMTGAGDKPEPEPADAA